MSRDTNAIPLEGGLGASFHALWIHTANMVSKVFVLWQHRVACFSSSMAFPTPSFAHLKQEDYENVYEPAEDTFLMMDALEKDADFLKERR